MFQKLVVSGESTACFEDGTHALSVASTKRAKELNNDVGWEKGKESWLSYRQRTAAEREAEKQKQQQFLQLLVDAFNDVNQAE